MIRKATQDDYQQIWEISLAFNTKHYDVPLDQDRFREWFDRHIAEGLTLLSDTGYISGLSVDDPVRNWTALVETAWYAEDGSGLRLLREFIRIGQKEFFDEVRMTTLRSTPARVLTLLERMGFEEFERSHRLIL